MKKTKAILITAVFALFIFGFFAAMLILPDTALSYSERRALAKAPELTAKSVLSGKYMTDAEEYLLDQFPLRDTFRSIKAAVRFYVFFQSDNNDVYLYNGSVFKMEYPLDEKQVSYAVDKLNSLVSGQLAGMNVYYSVIPDKNYFAAAGSGHMSLDYDALLSIASNIDAEYIDIMPLLSIDDYYRTDAHWRQERILPVAEYLAESMGADLPALDYESHTLFPFYGVYCGQSALPVGADELVYLTNPLTDSAVVTGIELAGEYPVYDIPRFSGMDGYDVYLSGAQSILTVELPDADTGRELIIFRDSFGSSISPLLLGAYSKITLVDLRYIPAALLGDYITFADQDVLFLYSTSILNSGRLLK